MDFEASEEFASSLDESDALRQYRALFHIPKHKSNEEVIYFAGNSLGLMPRDARDIVQKELTDWANLGVDAHFDAGTPWYSYHEVFRDVGARLVGARLGEVVMMNSLTINLHLMMISFFHPTKTRHKIMIEEPCFPSDIYAVKTHIKTRGLDPKQSLVTVKPRKGELTIRQEDIEAIIEREGESIALILLSGVNFFTGQVFDMQSITDAGHRHGCVVGFDLAHAAGNIELSLHDWDVDFAAWCSYKFLNSGPGAVAGCFIHEMHGKNVDIPRLAGWWGNDPDTRFRMHLEPEFIPVLSAEAWQISNPPILSMAPLKASLNLFDTVGMQELCAKSRRLTAYLRFLLNESPSNDWSIITPSAQGEHGCQLSLMVTDRPKERFKALINAGVVCDFREPNVIRVAPVPLYNTFHDVWQFARILAQS